MRFAIVTDTSSNLPTPLLEKNSVSVIPFNYIIDGQEYTCLDTESFDGASYYAAMKAGTCVATSQVTPQRYVDYLAPLLQQEQDILFVGMSSGISGSYASAEIAAAQLREQFPQRNIRLVDTLAASLGEGLFVLRAIDCREAGMSLDETADLLLRKRQSLYQAVMVDDLMHLRRGGRVSGAKAVLGTILGVRPILKGNTAGELVVCSKVRGQSAGVAALENKYNELVKNPEKQIVGIAHTGCPELAERLADAIRKSHPPKEVILVCYEPVTGSHLGPGSIALFFEGNDGVREY